MNPAYLACGGWLASAVGVAASLGLADLLADGPQDAAALAGAARVAEVPLARVMRVLASVGVFVEKPAGTFANNDESRLLQRDHPQSVRSWCVLAAGDYQRLFQAMGHTVATGEPATRVVMDGTLYAYLERTPDAADVYDRAMEDLARPLADLLAAGRDFSQIRTVVDVGGGRGTIVRGLLRAVPHLHGICIDRPDVCDRAALDVEPALRGRLTYVGGDFFVSVPAGADIYVVKNVVHNWDDERAAALLRPIAAAARAHDGARLWLIEPVPGGPMPAMYQAFDDLLQLVVCEAGARPRSVGELSSIAERAGFRVQGTETLRSGHELIEAVVAPAFQS